MFLQIKAYIFLCCIPRMLNQSSLFFIYMKFIQRSKQAGDCKRKVELTKCFNNGKYPAVKTWVILYLIKFRIERIIVSWFGSFVLTITNCFQKLLSQFNDVTSYKKWFRHFRQQKKSKHKVNRETQSKQRKKCIIKVKKHYHIKLYVCKECWHAMQQ